MIDLQTLEDAMADISSVGYVEHEFEINGKRYVLWPLTADQEREIFEYAETALEGRPGEDQGQAASIAYMDRFRIAAISQSLVVIDQVDLRNQEEVETGATLPNGQKEFVSRYQALRKFVSNWTKPLIEQVFLQFGEMTRRQEEAARNSVRYTPSDLSSELDHMEERLQWLVDQVERQENPDPDMSSKIRSQISQISKLQSRHRTFLATGGSTSEEEPEASENLSEDQDVQPQKPRPKAPQAFTAADRPVPQPRPESGLEPLEPVEQPNPPTSQSRFHRATPPPSRDSRPSRPKAPEAQSQPQQNFEQQFREKNPDIPEGENLHRYTPTGDSMIGDDEMASVEAEARRQALLRQQRMQRDLAEQRQQEEKLTQPNQAPAQGGTTRPGVQATPGGVMVAPGQAIPGQQRPPMRRPSPPHRNAARTQAQMSEQEAQVGPVTEFQGQPVYQPREREVLTPRTKRANVDQRGGKVVVDNPGGGNESRNPRFVGRNR